MVKSKERLLESQDNKQAMADQEPLIKEDVSKGRNIQQSTSLLRRAVNAVGRFIRKAISRPIGVKPKPLQRGTSPLIDSLIDTQKTVNQALKDADRYHKMAKDAAEYYSSAMKQDNIKIKKTDKLVEEMEKQKFNTPEERKRFDKELEKIMQAETSLLASKREALLERRHNEGNDMPLSPDDEAALRADVNNELGYEETFSDNIEDEALENELARDVLYISLENKLKAAILNTEHADRELTSQERAGLEAELNKQIPIKHITPASDEDAALENELAREVLYTSLENDVKATILKTEGRTRELTYKERATLWMQVDSKIPDVSFQFDNDEDAAAWAAFEIQNQRDALYESLESAYKKTLGNKRELTDDEQNHLRLQVDKEIPDPNPMFPVHDQDAKLVAELDALLAGKDTDTSMQTTSSTYSRHDSGISSPDFSYNHTYVGEDTEASVLSKNSKATADLSSHIGETPANAKPATMKTDTPNKARARNKVAESLQMSAEVTTLYKDSIKNFRVESENFDADKGSERRGPANDTP